MNQPDQIARILADTSVLLLDFDGPVCSVFAGIPAHVIADQLRSLIDPVPANAASTNDPLEVLRVVVALNDRDLTEHIEKALTHWELEAAKTAAPTPFAAEALAAAQASGRTVVIVSNNSAEAVEAYLAANRLEAHVRTVIGRSHARPELMKPNPDPVFRAITAVDATPTACVLLGDSVSDIQAARAAGTYSIGYANRPHKRTSLTDVGADALIEGPTGMEAIATAYTNTRPR